VAFISAILVGIIVSGDKLLKMKWSCRCPLLYIHYVRSIFISPE